MFPPQDGACGDEPICTALPGWSAAAGIARIYRRTIPLVKNEPSAATQSMAIACDAGRGVVDAVAASLVRISSTHDGRQLASIPGAAIQLRLRPETQRWRM